MISASKSTLSPNNLKILRPKVTKNQTAKAVVQRWSEGRGFDPCPMLDGSGAKAMPGLMPTPNSGSLQKNKRIQVAKWGTPRKYF